jgi:hypothetical protein
VANSVDLSQCLDELDPPAWGPPSYSSQLVRACHRLRTVPLEDFQTEDFRILIGQGFSLTWLLPLAVELLEREPLIEGDYFPGDLLLNVLRVEERFWEERADLEGRLTVLCRRFSAVPHGLNEVPEEVGEALKAYLNRRR